MQKLIEIANVSISILVFFLYCMCNLFFKVYLVSYRLLIYCLQNLFNSMVEKDTSIFIELLKKRNCLWQIKCKEYKNKVLRDMATRH